MIVTCPNCTTKLQLDGAKVPSRPFSVRCPKCQQIVNAQPPATEAHRDAVAAVGDVPSSARPRQDTAPAVAAPLMSEPPAPPAPAPTAESNEDVLRLLASLLRREASGEGGGEHHTAGARRPWERRRALICAGSAFGGDAARALSQTGYDVSVAADAAQAVERMREDQLDVLVLDPEFDPRSQGSMAVGREVTSMRTSERRRMVFVLLTNTARTGDAHAAFLAGANLVVQMKEVADLPRALEKNIRDLNELYRDFNRALGLAEL
ncbi:MAG TPA: zinc-ribbon domain-containing protein [Pyrinomonadaceae bacterium]|nr:zinc-ribbon domain-containing protein [Pyrinomonadaceae bacterium]